MLSRYIYAIGAQALFTRLQLEQHRIQCSRKEGVFLPDTYLDDPVYSSSPVLEHLILFVELMSTNLCQTRGIIQRDDSSAPLDYSLG